MQQEWILLGFSTRLGRNFPSVQMVFPLTEDVKISLSCLLLALSSFILPKFSITSSYYSYNLERRIPHERNKKGRHLVGCSCLPPLSALASWRLEFGKTIFCGQRLAVVGSRPLTSSAALGPPLLVSPTPRLAGPKLATPSHRLLRVSGSVPKDRSYVKDGLWGARMGWDWVGGGLGGTPSTS